MSAETQAPPPTPLTRDELALQSLSGDELIAQEVAIWSAWEAVQREFVRRGQLRQPALGIGGTK